MYVRIILSQLSVARVADASAENKMNIANLATTFGPVLFDSKAVSYQFLTFPLQLHCCYSSKTEMLHVSSLTTTKTICSVA